MGKVDVKIFSSHGKLADTLAVGGYIPISQAQVRKERVPVFLELVRRDQHNTASALFELIKKFFVGLQELRKMGSPI